MVGILSLNRRGFIKFVGLGLSSVWLGALRTQGQPTRPLKLSLMPAQDVVTLAFALERNLFTKHGLPVELVCGGNTLERNAAFSAGQLDALAVDLTSALVLLGRRVPAVIVSTLFEPAPNPRSGNNIVRTVALLTHKFSNYKTLDDVIKAGPRRQITLIQPSDMEYMTDQLLLAKGVRSGDLDRYYNGVEDYDRIQQIAQFLGAGSPGVPVGVLPEPHATLTEIVAEANQMGMLALADYQSVRTPPSVILFRRAVLEERGAHMSRFFAALRESITTLNGSSREFIISTLIKAAVDICFPDLKGQELQFPAGWQEKLRIPHFPMPRALKKEEFDAQVEWALGKRYIRERLAFESSVDFRYLGS